MTNLTISKSKWKNYFDDISKSARGSHIELEVAGLDLGDQIEEEWTQFEGLSYDPREDLLTIFMGSLEHTIPFPQEVIAAIEGPLASAVLVKDTGGHSQILKFRSPLLLMSPQ